MEGWVEGIMSGSSGGIVFNSPSEEKKKQRGDMRRYGDIAPGEGGGPLKIYLLTRNGGGVVRVNVESEKTRPV